MRWLKPLATFLIPGLLLLPMTGADPKASPEAPWRETAWTGAFAVPRPSLPGAPGHLECAGQVSSQLRIRIFRVEDPETFLQEALQKGARTGEEPEQGLLEGGRAGQDPLDLLREAILWGSRRAFVTAHRVASRGLRDIARQTERLQEPRTQARSPRDGGALSLEGMKGLTLVTEIIPKAAETVVGAEGAPEGTAEDGTGEEGVATRVELPPQGAGVYLLELLQEEQAAYLPWLVTDLALLAEQDAGTLRVQAVSALDGTPRGGVVGRLHSSGKAQPLTFDAEGRARCAAGPGVKRVVLARAGSSLALVAIEGQGAASVTQRLYAFTERPLYRPGQEVFVKAILREVAEGENRVPRGPAVLPFRVLDPEDTEVAKGEASLQAAQTATYACAFTMPNGGRLGLHRVVFQGPQGPGQAEFKVEHFVKPAFQVKVTAATAKLTVGDPLVFQARADYFYGAPVRSGKADWFLYLVKPKVDDYYGIYAVGPEDGPAPQLVESGQVDLAEDGTLALPTFPAGEEGLWRMVVKVADPSGQRNGGSAQVRAAVGDFTLTLSADRNVALPGRPIGLEARALDLDGHPVQVPVTLKATEVIGERMHAWMKPHALKPGKVVAETPGPKGQLSIPTGGVYLMLAEARDAKGRLIRAQRLMTVADEGTPLPASPDLRASADKREYQPGETARILVMLPKPQLTLHWALEHEALGERHTRVVPGTTALVEIPLSAAHQPNAWAVFEIVAEGRRQMVEVPLRVPRKDRQLSVNVVPDRDRYQPGQTMTVNVEVKDHLGRPSAADLSLGVVDEAIYALSAELHPDPVRFFHPTRRHNVLRSGSTDWTFWDLLRRQRPVWALRQTRRGEFKSDDADKVRQNFKDTAYWKPFLAAGADGKASAAFELPDNLTAWRATATAVTGDTKVGVGRASRPASKPLQVSLVLPRTLSVGEEARAIALVRNLSGKPLSGSVRLEVGNGQLSGEPRAAFGPIPDQGEFRFALPLLTAKEGPLTVTARVEGGALKDAERRTVKVLDPLVPVTLNGALVLDGTPKTLTVPIPPQARGTSTFTLTPVGRLEHLMAPSLPYLIRYPYGCVEQTLSAFVPNLLVADLVKQGLFPPLEWQKLADLDRNIRDGIFRVYGYQMPNGGWSWWAPKDFNAINPHTTGFAVQSMALMKRQGYAVDEGSFRRGRQAAMLAFQEAARKADARGKAPYDAKQHGGDLDPAADAAFLLLSLAHAGEPVAGMLDSTAEKALKGVWPGGHVLAMTALAAAETKHPCTASLIDRLEKSVLAKGGLAHWEGRRDCWWTYVSGEVLPTIYAMKALALSRPASPLLPQAEAFLSTEYRGYGWFSTWSTGQAIGLLPALAKVRQFDWGPPGQSAKVQGGPSWDFHTADKLATRPWGSRDPRPGFLLMPEPEPVTLTATGSGVMVWTYGYGVPGSAAPPAQAQAGSALRMNLERKLWRLRTPQETGNAPQGWVRQPWTGTLRQGEEAWMELYLRTAQHADYAILEVPIPAGLEPTVKLEGFVLEGKPFADGDASEEYFAKPRIEVHPDKVSFLFPRLYSWASPRIRILLRAGMAGSYTLRPAKLSLMSNEAQWVTCDGAGLKITEGGRK